MAFVQCCCSPVSTGTVYDYSIVHLNESLNHSFLSHRYTHAKKKQKVPSVFSNVKILCKDSVNNFVLLTRICDCKRSITIEVVFNRITSEAKLSLIPLWKCFWVYIRQAVQQGVCLLEGFLCESRWKSVKGAKVAWITSGFPDPACWHFGLFSHYAFTCSHLLVSHRNANLHPCQPLIPLCFSPYAPWVTMVENGAHKLQSCGA